jgi:predicted ribosome quality control (RQC) complex YloA/Tae2 family protein
MSNFDIAVLLNEISQSVIGAWISNIYQIKEVFLFKLNTRTGDKMLLIEPGSRIHLTRYVRPIPRTPTNLCAALRKHIRNGQVEIIRQHDLDRIVTIHIKAHSREYRLVAELFGEGNLILCDSEDRVVLARHYRVMRDRTVKPKEILVPPPPRGTELSVLSEDLILSIMDTSSSGLVETLASKLNIDPLYAEEICLISNVEKNRKAKDLDAQDKAKIIQAIQSILNKFKNGPYEPGLVLNEVGEPVSVTPFRLRVYAGLSVKSTDGYNDALDEFFSGAEANAARGSELKERDLGITEVENAIREQRKKIDETEKLQIRYRTYGDLIYSNLPEVDEILSVVRVARKKGVSWQEIEDKLRHAEKAGIVAADRVVSLDAKEGVITLKLGEEEIEMDIRTSATDIASRFYEAAKKAESKRKGAESALQNALNRLKELEKEKASVRQEALREKPQKKWYERYRWFISSDGFLVIGGRDVRTNEMIVKRRLEPSDAFIHADVHGAPVVIVKSNGKDIPESTLREACQFSVSYSKLWKAGVGAGDAYWTSAEQVSLTPPSGEYLQKGSFIVRGQRNYVKGIALRISIGVVTDDNGNVIPIAGPPPSVIKRTGIKIDLIPGEEAGSRLANLVKSTLTKVAPTTLRPRIAEVPIDEFLLLLPPGGASITESSSIETR